MLGGLWVPACAGKTRDRKARGPGTAVVPLSQYGPQPSGLSAGTMPGFPPRSSPPRKHGPRNHAGGAATTEISSLSLFAPPGGGTLETNSAVRGTGALVVRSTIGIRPEQ